MAETGAGQGPALLLIDVQTGFDDPRWGQRNNPDAETRMMELLGYWRVAELPVVHIQHASREVDSPLSPEAPGFAIKAELEPLSREALFVKSVNSAFIGTGLESYLRQQGIDDVVVIGLTTDHCVSTTTRMAGNLGFKVYVIDDATATFDRAGHDGRHYSADELHAISLASLNGEFCEVLSTAQILEKLGAA